MQLGIRNMIRMVLLQERATVAVLFGFLLLPMVGIVGIAVDTARAYSVKVRLQESIDSAALVGAKNISLPASERNQMMRDYFYANWRYGYMGADDPVLSTPIVDTSNRTVTITANVTMPTIFMRLFDTPEVTVGTLTSTISGMTYLEVALALDNTSSMSTLNGGSTRMVAMKSAATSFMNTLFTENGVVQDSVDNMWVSVVPFTSLVNIGAQHTNFLVPGSTDNILWDWPKNGTTQNSWRGCVFERSFYNESPGYAGRDMTDDSPAVEAYYPFHVPRMHVEIYTHCHASGYVAPPVTPPVTPPPAPPPTCSYDGVACKVDANTIKFPILENPALIEVSGSPAPACRYGGNQVLLVGSYLMRPGYVYVTPSGHTIQYTETLTQPSTGFNRNIASLYNNSYVAAENASGVSACCGAGFNNYTPAYATRAGRWIAPWPNATSPKLGGWGNTGCGLALRPLTAQRQQAVNLISQMDVPPSPVPAVNPPGYVQSTSGTLINQGLVWAWRSISPNYRGFWREPSGTSIDPKLPLDYGITDSIKAVVVMTDGLNFLPDLEARFPGETTTSFVRHSIGTGNTAADYAKLTGSPGFWVGPDTSAFTDNSAYGIISFNQTLFTKLGTLGMNSYSYCRQRQAAGFELHLAIWGCREYDCMLRDSSNNCLRSSAVSSGSPAVGISGDPLTGPYYTELTRRLLVTCQNMRNQNIRIFFILFDINNNPQKTQALQAFRTCAGGDSQVYDASNAAELSAAFQTIANRLRELRLRK